MNYHNITKDDMKNGKGLRVVLWVAGCNHHCPGCHNPETWSYDSGIPFDDAAKEEIFEQLSKDYIDGITFSGGDPLAPRNRRPVHLLIEEIREKFPDKTIWLYTGYEWDFVKKINFIHLVDVVVDGEFKQDLFDAKYEWAGSTNQRVINVAEELLK